jgi:hypothetical protein
MAYGRAGRLVRASALSAWISWPARAGTGHYWHFAAPRLPPAQPCTTTAPACLVRRPLLAWTRHHKLARFFPSIATCVLMLIGSFRNLSDYEQFMDFNTTGASEQELAFTGVARILFGTGW